MHYHQFWYEYVDYDFLSERFIIIDNKNINIYSKQSANS